MSIGMSVRKTRTRVGSLASSCVSCASTCAALSPDTQRFYLAESDSWASSCILLQGVPLSCNRTKLYQCSICMQVPSNLHHICSAQFSWDSFSLLEVSTERDERWLALLLLLYCTWDWGWLVDSIFNFFASLSASSIYCINAKPLSKFKSLSPSSFICITWWFTPQTRWSQDIAVSWVNSSAGAFNLL